MQNIFRDESASPRKSPVHASQGLPLAGIPKLGFPGFQTRHWKCTTQLCLMLLLLPWYRNVKNIRALTCCMLEKGDRKQEVFPKCWGLGEWLSRYDYNQEKLFEYTHFISLYLTYDLFSFNFFSFNNTEEKHSTLNKELLNFPCLQGPCFFFLHLVCCPGVLFPLLGQPESTYDSFEEEKKNNQSNREKHQNIQIAIHSD